MERLVFVYGNLKRGFYNHRILTDGGARYDGPARTVYSYIMAHGIAFPYVIDPATPATMPIDYSLTGRVTGEVYCVDADTLADLDRLEGHPDFYARKLVPVILNGWPDLGGPYPKAWLYFLPADRLDTDRLADIAACPDAQGNLTWTQADIDSDLQRMKG